VFARGIAVAEVGAMHPVEHYIDDFLHGESHFISQRASYFLLFRAKEARLVKEAYRFQTRVAAGPGKGYTPAVAASADALERLRIANLKLRSSAYQYYLSEIRKHIDSYPSRVFVGRTEQCDIIIPDGRISKLHAYFELGDALRVADAGSRNGCRLNDQPLTPQLPAPVCAGDSLEIGPFAFTLVSSKKVYAEIAHMLEPLVTAAGVGS
jgi:hypothetical protein